jgi:5'-3' exonuclease
MKTRTLLIDASYLLKRSFFGAKDVYTKFGHLGAVYQFLTTTRKLIKEHMSNKVILIWDGQRGGIQRYQIDHEYKANRKDKCWNEDDKIVLTEAEIRREKDKEISLLKQRVRIQAYAENLFLRQIEIEDIEADDIIAAYCLKYNNKEELFIYSNDRDFAQLLDLNITILFSNIDQPVNKLNYFMYFNHHYLNALILKIICGDVSDNINGIDGMGETILLKYFPELKFKHLTVREICKKADEINKERIVNNKKPLKALENLLNNIDRLKMNFQLVNLREPLLNEQAEEALKDMDMPLSPKDRKSKYLYEMMMEDEFLSVYGSTFVQYVEPFYTVIMNEKDLLTEYYKNKKNKL